MVIRFDCFGKRIAFDFSVRNKRVKMIDGYTNRCKDGKYVVCLDYDNVELEWIYPELERLQADFDLGTFYVFRSSENSYHCVCLDKVLFCDFVSILECSTIDPNYLKVPLKFGKKIWTLRLSPKDEEIEFIKALPKDSVREQSFAHGMLLEKFFGIDVPESQDKEILDNEIIFARYPI